MLSDRRDTASVSTIMPVDEYRSTSGDLARLASGAT
jgi:hypothetical protein